MKKLFSLLSLAALITAVGCESNDEPARPEIKLSKTEFTASDEMFLSCRYAEERIDVKGDGWELGSIAIEGADAEMETIYGEIEGVGRTITGFKGQWFEITRDRASVNVKLEAWETDTDAWRTLTLVFSAPRNDRAATLVIRQSPLRYPGDWDDNIKLSSKELTFDATGGEQQVTTESESWSMVGLYIPPHEYSFYYIDDYEGLLTAEYDPGMDDGRSPVRVCGEWFDISREARSITVKLAPNEGPAREMVLNLNLGDYNSYLTVKQDGVE